MTQVSFPSFLRSYLPQTGSAPPSLDFLSDRGATPTATPLYLPTTVNPSSYCTVVVERKVAVQLPSSPQKDPRIIELEVVELPLYSDSLSLYVHIYIYIIESAKFFYCVRTLSKIFFIFALIKGIFLECLYMKLSLFTKMCSLDLLADLTIIYNNS